MIRDESMKDTNGMWYGCVYLLIILLSNWWFLLLKLQNAVGY